MSQDEVPQKISKHEYDLMIVKRRRFRPAKACYPCRRRRSNAISVSPVIAAPSVDTLIFATTLWLRVRHHFFREFVDSVVLCLCRPTVPSYGDAYSKELTETYLKCCRSVLHTYLELLRLACPIRRSWVFVHVTLSCALTLGLAANAENDISDKAFLKEFLDTFSQANIFPNVSSYQDALQLLRKSLGTND